MPRKTPPLPLPVRRALKKLGKDVREARLRRRIRTTVMADRVQVSRPTLRKLEQGDPSVSIGAYATALYVLGLVDRLADLADIAADPVGRQMASEALPQRIASKILEGDDLSASLDLAFAAAGHFGIENDEAKAIAKQVAGAVAGWRSVARGLGASSRECDRMASAFEHESGPNP